MAVQSKKKRITFSDILKAVGEENANRLMQKARRFNYIAKIATSEQQHRVAYVWKNRCLKQLLDKCQSYSVLEKETSPHKGLVLIHLKNNARGLHTHPNWLNQN